MERLSAKNEKDLFEVEKFYEKGIDFAAKQAFKDLSALIKEIKYYRSHSFEEIESDLATKLDERLTDEEFNKIVNEKVKLSAFYSSLDSDQLQKFANMYYIRMMESYLLSERVKSIEKAADKLDKKEPSVLYQNYMQAGSGYVGIDPQGDFDKSTKEKIKKGLKSYGGSWALFSAFVAAVTVSSIAFAEWLSGEPFMGSVKMNPDLFPYILSASVALGGVSTFAIGLKDKRVVDQLKAFGIYDVALESVKANKEFKVYIEELEATSGVKLPEENGGKVIR